MWNPITALARVFVRRETEPERYPGETRVRPTGYRTAAGVRVTPDTAVCVSTVWGCLRYISQTVAVFPWHVMRPGPLGAERASTHPLDWLLYKQPNPEWSSMQFRETLTHWALRWGNGYAEIERGPFGRPIALWPLHPARVSPMRTADDRRQLFYRVSNDDGTYTDLMPEDVFHIRGFGEDVIGVNVMDYAAESIGWARAAMLFGAAFFGDGMNVTGVVTTKRTLQKDALRRMKAGFRRLYAGVRGEKVMFLDADADYKTVGIDPEKAQFLGTNEYLVREICRWFGVPPHKVADLSRATWSNVEAENTAVVVDCIAPWVRRWEDEADIKLFGQNRMGLYTKMNMNALLRGDVAARAQYYREMRGMGVLNADDIRELEDMNKLPPGKGGDKYVMQSQYTTLDIIGTPQAQPAPTAPRGAPPGVGAISGEDIAAMADLLALEHEEITNVRQ